MAVELSSESLHHTFTLNQYPLIGVLTVSKLDLQVIDSAATICECVQVSLYRGRGVRDKSV